MKLNKPLLRLLALHLGLMAIVGSCVVFLFFWWLLPVVTHNGQFITVPDLKGMTLEAVDTCLTQRSLNFEVTEEFAYAPEYPPMTVLQQYPKVGARVKDGRKIYLTLNTKTPPTIKMLNLVDGSVRNAHVCLKSQGLLLGVIKYVPDVAQNAVLEQWYQGQKITPGTYIVPGAKIDLVVGAGLGTNMVDVPSVLGMKIEDAQLLFFSAGIKMRHAAYEVATDQAPGTILRQIPDAGKKVKIGESVDVWLVAFPEKELVAPDMPILSEY